jgi:hypothetical protein
MGRSAGSDPALTETTRSAIVPSFPRYSLGTPVAALLTAACVPAPGGYPRVADLTPRLALASPVCPAIQQGGYGSALAVGQGGTIFYLLTDRGPNFDGPADQEKIFPIPSFTPEIGVFRLAGGRLELVGAIALRDAAGHALSGLPNPPGAGGTGERALGPDRQPLDWDSAGLDPEGLVALQDGTFWIADEYGPHLVHVDRTGRTLERLNPFGAGRRLPRVLARRRPNRGIEGLTALPGDSILAAILQSPLDNPAAAGRRSVVVRLVLVHLPSGRSRQYLYLLDDPDDVTSDVAAVGPERLLVLEQDSRFPRDPRSPSRQKRIYEVDLSEATDVSDPADGPDGRLVRGRTLEALAEGELRAAGIVPAAKRLVVDLLDPAIGYVHDKAEGLARLPDGRLAVSNDDDFGIESDGRGGCVAKHNPVTGEPDRGEVYFIRPRR